MEANAIHRQESLTKFGGRIETVVGVAGFIVPGAGLVRFGVTNGARIIGGALAVRGADHVVAGVGNATTGEYRAPGLERGVASGLEGAGFSRGSSRTIAGFVGLGTDAALQTGAYFARSFPADTVPLKTENDTVRVVGASSNNPNLRAATAEEMRLLRENPAALNAPEITGKVVQLDANLVAALADPANANHAFAKAFIEAEAKAGTTFTINRHTYQKLLEVRGKEVLKEQIGTHKISLLRDVELDQIDSLAKRLQRAFTESGDPRRLSAEDARVAASAYLKNEEIITGDLQFYYRARDLKLPVRFVGNSANEAKAAAYKPPQEFPIPE